jgi:hypothetical protein
MNDEILGRVVDRLRQLGWEQTTDIIITQDHNHSTVSGDVAHYPLRGIADGRVGPHDPYGYSVSGFVRTAALLTLDGLKANDGAGCPANAGSDYLFVPDGDANTVKAAVVSLQSRLQFGAVFVSDKYGDIAGTLRMGLINTEGPGSGRGPDIIVSFSFDEHVAVAGRPGISYASSVNRRGRPRQLLTHRHAYFDDGPWARLQIGYV